MLCAVYRAHEAGGRGPLEFSAQRKRAGTDMSAKKAAKTRRTKPLMAVAPASPCSASWHDHEMMSVVGCIDSNGAITARACKQIDSHRPDECRGKRWRWLVWSQDFHSVPPRTVEEANNRIAMLHLDEEEHFAVCDWLIRHGYANESILPNPLLDQP